MEYSIVPIQVERVRVGDYSSWEGLEALLSRVEFIQSTVAKNGTDVIDADVRLSEVSKHDADIALSEDVSDHFNRTLPPTKCISSALMMVSERAYLRHIFRFGPVKLLKYTTGCFFKCHTDTRKGLDHLLTVLLFPPLKNYEGGELILHTGDGDVNVEEHRNPLEWTLVMFRPDVPHEVTPVTSGVRYVFKTDFYSDKYFGNVDAIASSKPVDGDKLLKKLETYVNNFNSSEYETSKTEGWDTSESPESPRAKWNSEGSCYMVDDFESKIQSLLQDSLDKSLHNDVKKVMSVDELLRRGTLRKGIYVMTRLYPGAEDETSLIGPHRRLYLDLKERYRFVRLMTATFVRNVGEVTSTRSIIRIAHHLDEWGNILMLNNLDTLCLDLDADDFEVFYESAFPHGPHAFHTEYNDSTYNLETTIYTTIIMFMSPK